VIDFSWEKGNKLLFFKSYLYMGGDTIPRRVIYYVTPHDGKWQVKKEKGKKATSVHETKEEAVVEAKKLTRKSTVGQVKVQKRNGKFQVEYTYGEDLEKYPG